MQDPMMHQFIQKNQTSLAIERALTLSEQGSLDYSSCDHLASNLIEKGLLSDKPSEILIALYAGLICEKNLDVGRLDNLFKLEIPFIQHLILNHFQNFDLYVAYPTIKRALSSPDLGIRLHACQILAHSGHKEGLGQLEALMHRVPLEFRYIFADIFAQLGSKDAHIQLKTLLEDKLWTNRVAALLAVADFRQDGLLPYLRTSLSHTQPAEIEAAAYGLGCFGDLDSSKKLDTLMKSKVDEIALSSALALHRMGVYTAKEFILNKAKEKDLYAVNLLSEITSTSAELDFLLSDQDLNIRLNATRALVKKRHPSGLLHAYSLLKDLPPMTPKFSAGRTLFSLKMDRRKETLEYALAFRKQYAYEIFSEIFCYPFEELRPYLEQLIKNKEWVPLITRLLYERGDENALSFLQKLSQTPGNPYLRIHAELALYQKKPSLYLRTKLLDYLQKYKDDELVRFQGEIKKQLRYSEMFLEPTPEEKSELFISIMQALCVNKDKQIAKTFLSLLEKGHPSNRPLIAAFLLLAIR
jgi:HEAT repeat protein